MGCGNYTAIAHSQLLNSLSPYFGENATGKKKGNCKEKEQKNMQESHVHAYLCVIDFIRVPSPHTVCMIQILQAQGVLTLKRVIWMFSEQDSLFHPPQLLHKTPFLAYFISTRPPFLNKNHKNFEFSAKNT